MSGIPAAVAGFITDGRVGRLGTADASGQPLVVPICYAWDGAALFSAIDAKPKARPGAGLKRIKNIAENPKVSVVIDRYDEDWRELRYVIIQGEATLLTRGADFARGADLLLEKYPQYRTMGLDRAEGLMIKVAPSKVTHWQLRAEESRDLGDRQLPPEAPRD
jgi:PPOX class probable F420-dependent enzyme